MNFARNMEIWLLLAFGVVCTAASVHDRARAPNAQAPPSSDAVSAAPALPMAGVVVISAKRADAEQKHGPATGN